MTEEKTSETPTTPTPPTTPSNSGGSGEWLKRVGLGALIWVIMFAWVSVLMFVFKLETGWLSYFLTWIGVVVAVWFIAGLAKLKDLTDAFLLGLIFVVVGVILDYLVTRQFNAEILMAWSLWVGYAITLLIPVIRTAMKK